MSAPVAKIAMRGITAAVPVLGGRAAAALAPSGPVRAAPVSLGSDSFGSAPTRALAVQSFAHAHHLGALAASNVSAARHRTIMNILANQAPRAPQG
ncbi:MAG TPA: hypothetical protein VFH51_13320 [Myxococcota bacterium]|nr:hypothetical protein [Myxococcota bacterium]